MFYLSTRRVSSNFAERKVVPIESKAGPGSGLTGKILEDPRALVVSGRASRAYTVLVDFSPLCITCL